MNIQRVKKVELHCHVDGLLNHHLLKEFPPTNKHNQVILELEKLCPVTSLYDWIENYGTFMTPIVSNNGEFLLAVLERYLTTLRTHNVIYSEIMLSSFTFQYDDINRQLELYSRFRELADQFAGHGLHVEFLIAFGRTRKRDRMERLLGRILKVHEHGIICGVAVAGLEEPNTIKPYADIFQEFKRAGLGVEIHAGEWQGPESIWEALEYGYADRIGHGLSAFEDPALINYIKEHQIHLEFCPTSNLLLTNVNDIHNHPIKYTLEEDISFSINTDDPGPFCCDITNEYKLVQEAFALTETDIDKIVKNSLQAAFASKLK